jgi:NADH-quinone oxidoreductase subunit J
MLLGAERMARTRQFDWQVPMAVVMALILIVEAAYVIFFRDGANVVLAQSAPDFAAPVAIGTIFFQEYFLPFQITGVLLLVAMIGAIVITKQEKKKRS